MWEIQPASKRLLFGHVGIRLVDLRAEMQNLSDYGNTFIFLSSNGSPCDDLAARILTRPKWKSAQLEKAGERFRYFPKAACGWSFVSATHSQSPTETSECVDGQFAVCAYGDVLNAAGERAARLILKAWVEGGVAKVLELNGNFGAVVVDLQNGAVNLVSDPIGHRSLRYWATDSMLLVSPHDVALVATGLVPPDLDFETAASIAAVGWSIKGASLIRNVKSERGGDHVRWHRGTLEHTRWAPLESNGRFSPRDRGAIKRTIDEMIGSVRENLRILGQTHQIIYTDLTAGQDTRAVLSLLLSVVPRDQIVAVTGGKNHSGEVSVAARLAKLYRVRHRIAEEESSCVTLPEFKQTVDALAFGMNGDSNAKYAATYSAQFTGDYIHLTGGGGEIFRGRFYMRRRVKATDDRFPAEVSDILNLVPHYGVSALLRLMGTLSELRAQSETWFDLLDLFQLRESHAVWGALGSRTYIGKRSFEPLVSARVTRLMGRMPSPMGKYATYAHEGIRRFTPRAYWTPVNDDYILPFDQSRLLSLGFRYCNRLLRRASMNSNGSRPGAQLEFDDATPEGAAASAFAGPLAEYVRALLTDSRSFGAEIFGRPTVERFLNEHGSRKRNQLCYLGPLVTAEHFRNLIQEAAA